MESKYKLMINPVDPYDAFRGRYIYLNFTNTVVTNPKDSEIEYNKSVYVLLDIRMKRDL